ncbi:MAG: PAS domain S-box protein [Bacteroidales bacterium]|nr:PAS domain S-box protein [Bacteroidales bacterium]
MGKNKDSKFKKFKSIGNDKPGTTPVFNDLEISEKFLRLINGCNLLEDLLERSLDFILETFECTSSWIEVIKEEVNPYFQDGANTRTITRCVYRNSDRSISQMDENCMPSFVNELIFNPTSPSDPGIAEDNHIFWTNNAGETAKSSGDSEKAALKFFREKGFETFALLPLLSGREPLGIMMVGDNRLEWLNAEKLGLLKRIIHKLEIGISRLMSLESLRESEKRYRNTLDNMLEGCQIIGYDWRYLYVNDSVAGHGRKSKAELLGHTMMEVYPGIDETELFKTLQKCMHDRVARRVENHFVYPDDSDGWFDLSIQPVPEGLFLLSIDITDRKKIEKALQSSEAKFRSVFDNSVIGKSLTQPTGELEVNRAFAQMVGYTLEELNNKTWSEITHPDDLEKSKKLTDELLTGKTDTIRMKKRYTHKNGSVVWVDVGSSVQRDAEGKVLFHITSMRDISEQVKAEEKLRTSEQRLKLFVEHAPAAIAMFDNEMNYIAVSRRYYKDYQLKDDDIIGKNHYEVFPELNEYIRSIHKRCLAGATESSEEDPFERLDGSMDWVRWEMHPWYENKNRIGGVILFSEVITERKRSREKLNKYNQQLEFLHDIDTAILESKSPQEIATVVLKDIRILIPESQRISVTEIYVEENKASLLALLDHDKVKYMSDSELPLAVFGDIDKFTNGEVHLITDVEKQVSDPRVLKHLKAFRAKSYLNVPLVVGGELVGSLNFAMENPIHFSDDTMKVIRRIAHQMAIALSQARMLEKIQGYASYLEQMVEERTAELAVSEMRYKQLFEQAPDAIGLFDMKTGKFSEFNSKAHEMLGYTRKEFAKLSLSEIEALENKKDAELHVNKILRSGTDEFETKHRLKSGEFINVHVTASRIDIDGRTYILSIWNDITRRKRQEKAIRILNEDLRYRQQQLEDANQELESFAYSVSHDLRAPLRAINGFTQVLLDEYGVLLDEEGKRIGDTIIRNTKKMGQLIDDLLQFSRMGRTSMTLLRVNMQHMVQSIYEDIVDTDDRKRIDFIVSDLPEIIADKKMIRQVWVNLIGNAVKFTSKVKHPKIEISYENKKGIYTFRIKDNGAGFNMDYADKLFGVFQRLHSQKEFEGTGVGLALVKRIVNRHGGNCFAEGEPGKGATFCFSLPINIGEISVHTDKNI